MGGSREAVHESACRQACAGKVGGHSRLAGAAMCKVVPWKAMPVGSKYNVTC